MYLSFDFHTNPLLKYWILNNIGGYLVMACDFEFEFRLMGSSIATGMNGMCL